MALAEGKLMILDAWRRRRANRMLIDQLHGAIVAAARAPALYREFGAPDTQDGRFEMIALHGALALDRLGELGPLGDEIAQELADSVFRHFDDALREMGVGDTVVPRRVKKMAEAFYGRGLAYRTAWSKGDEAAAADAMARNVYGVADASLASRAAALAAYARRCRLALRDVPIEAFAAGQLSFPTPAESVPS
jgi:cytochrome b pre-mRNA-processing protein 3